MNETWDFISGLLILLFSASMIIWLLWRWLKKTTEPRWWLVFKWIATIATVGLIIKTGLDARGDGIMEIFAIFKAALLSLILVLLWVPAMVKSVGSLFGQLYDGGAIEIEAAPTYSLAQAKRKRGWYDQALAEIRKQLHRFPEDYEGHLLMAQIHAEDLHDLDKAEEVIDELCAIENLPPEKVSGALNCLAEWNLKATRTPEGAREILERIVNQFPDSDVAQLARQRIAHLPSQEMLAEKAEPHHITMVKHTEKVGLREDFEGFKRAPQDYEAELQELLDHLKIYPEDNNARENLAVLYAKHFKRYDLAYEQFEQLIATPHQTSKNIVKWLNMKADIQVGEENRPDLARKSLERIIEVNPKAAAAENANKRIQYLHLEGRAHKKSHSIKLGSYKNKIGLKKARTQE
jgi:tetratricopeptide (TPR) repeat protein